MIDLPNDQNKRFFRDIFPYPSPPKIKFDAEPVPMNLPEKIWITDTTFRDGQQAREPYTADQVVHLYDLMHKLGGQSNIIKYTEFFLYTKEDRRAIETCLERGYEYPIVTSWIRATDSDLDLVKKVNMSETGILSSLSDYHIVYKFGWTREQTIENHLSVAENCLKEEIIPRCHIEDCTRADIDDVVLPFVQRLMKLSEEYGLPTKVRICDTLGLGVSDPYATLPRSIPKLIHKLTTEGGIPNEWLEFHGHNDFHQSISASTAAWLYGCCGNNGTLLGIGERAGNTPIDGLVFQLLQLKDDLKVDTKVIKEIAEYYEEIGFTVPEFYPLIGSNYPLTRAGVHADGMVKNPEIYASFDFEKSLGTPMNIIVGRYSGASGIAWKINKLLGLKRHEWIHKNDPRVLIINEYILDLYEAGRVTAMSDKEMIALVRTHFPELIKSPERPLIYSVHSK